MLARHVSTASLAFIKPSLHEKVCVCLETVVCGTMCLGICALSCQH